MDEEIDEPLLVGHTNKRFGFNGFEPILEGTPVYELDGRWYVEHKMIKDGSIHKVWYRKDSGLDKYFNKIEVVKEEKKIHALYYDSYINNVKICEKGICPEKCLILYEGSLQECINKLNQLISNLNF